MRVVFLPILLALVAFGACAVPDSANRYHLDDRIVNGQVATPGQFPYQAAVYIEFSGFCGGSLISDSWVLTAAHCAHKRRTWTVYLGAHDMTAPREEGRLVLTTSKGFVHEEYDPVTIRNDVAVLRLNRPVTLSSHIQPIRLPRQSQLNDLFVGRLAIVSGWGLIASSASTISPLLRYVDLTIISNDQCNATYDSEPIFPTTLCCQGENRKSTCNGDSGGPLVIQDSDGKSTQVGVVSFGSDSGCDKGFPHGYSRVTAYMPWVSKTTGIPIQN